MTDLDKYKLKQIILYIEELNESNGEPSSITSRKKKITKQRGSLHKVMNNNVPS